MRPGPIIGFLFLLLLALYGSGLWLLWGLEITREYESYGAAADDNVFGRGWLPEFIPASATRMAVTNDLDHNTSRGAFRYDPAETSAFLSRLRPWQGGGAPIDDYAARVAEMESRGYRPYEFNARGNVWVFFVDAAGGRVEYDMWPDFAGVAEGVAILPRDQY